jgi:hypothetical protein
MALVSAQHDATVGDAVTSRRTRRRNLADALRAHEHAAGWCDQHGWSLRVHNGGHHWIFEREGTVVEWWPSSAKLVRDKAWTSGIHTHGWEQVERILEAWT